MTQMATITSKKQLTLPAQLFKQAGFRIGQKVIVSEENGTLKITSAEKLVEELSGSIRVPKKWKNKSADQIIEESKNEYFSKKYKSK